MVAREEHTPSCYYFDDVVVDCPNFRVLKTGESRTLEPRLFDLLVFLIENRGRVVEKQELFERVWKQAFVTDNALTRAIKEIRRAIGDDATSPRYVETIPKRGYRFIAEVRKSEEPVRTVIAQARRACRRAQLPGCAQAWPGGRRRGISGRRYATTPHRRSEIPE